MSDTMRLFFGIAPDFAAREALSRAASGVAFDRGRLYDRDLYHLTLVFLGQTPTNRTETLLSIADQAFSDPFDLTLAPDMGAFKGGSVLWAGVKPSEELLLLRARLRTLLLGNGFPGGEAEYTPHITLGRNMRLTAPTPPVGEAAFTVRRITLYESVRVDERLVYRPIVRRGGQSDG